MILRAARLPLLAGALFAAVPAAAECPEITPSVDDASPPDGATDIPRNAAIVFGVTPRFAGYAPSVTLTSTSSGSAVAGTLAAGPAESYLFRPDSPLSASTSYGVQIVDSSGNGTPLSFDFTTGADSDTTDPVFPDAPVVTLGEYQDPIREPGCQQPGYWVLHADWEPVENETAVLYVLDLQLEDLIPQEIVSHSVGLRPPIALPVASLASGSLRSPLSSQRSALVATDSERSFNAPESSEVRVRVFAVDAAGRQAASPETVVETPAAPGADAAPACGCSLAPRTAPAGALLVSLAIPLLLLRRRRHGIA